ncbi:hypothetical protein [Mesorhizobium sp. M1406]|uniref:hypothetical protein n=1 Tax=Mesorhizobium sp. M1406 TaxID=2957099 RepID=UPI00333C47D5
MGDDWSVESLRFSLFSSEVPKGTDADWTELTGQEEAETRQNVPGGKVYVGEWGLGRLTLGFGPGRVDVVLGNKAATPDHPGLPVFAKWLVALEEFQELTSRFLGNFSRPVTRIAFGAVLLQHAASEAEVNALLQTYIKAVKINERYEDVLYRVNSPVVSIVDGGKINRITNFASLKIQTGAFKLGSVEPPIILGDEAFAARLELDHSTSAQRASPFDSNLVVPIWNELIGLARENAEIGEM